MADPRGGYGGCCSYFCHFVWLADRIPNFGCKTHRNGLGLGTKDRRLLLWTSIFLLLWLILSSFRAGGDLWDNPRYRVAFLPWLALLSGWAILWAIEHRDAWLVRWLVV